MGDEGSFKKGFIAGQKVACKTRVVLAANNTNYIAKIPGIETTPWKMLSNWILLWYVNYTHLCSFSNWYKIVTITAVHIRKMSSNNRCIFDIF